MAFTSRKLNARTSWLQHPQNAGHRQRSLRRPERHRYTVREKTQRAAKITVYVATATYLP